MTSVVFSRADVRYEVLVADITTLSVEALVTAANSRLAGGGGVDGAIHRAAGPGLLAECRALGGCPTGEARITAGHDLAARFVIHAVGPVWQGGGRGEAALLASAYRAAVDLARRHGVTSLAFPAISTGIYGFPGREAAEIAVAAVLEATIAAPPARIVFCCFSPDAARWHRDALERSIPS